MAKYKKKLDDDLLANAPIGKTFCKLAVPAVAAQLINILYNLVIFILPVFTRTSVIGVFMTEPIADTIAVCTTATMFYRYYKNL